MLGARGVSSVLRLTGKRYASDASRALVYDKFGAPLSVLKLENQTVPAPKEGEIKLKMVAAPISLFDADKVMGSHPDTSSFPQVAGTDGVGVVEEVGGGVSLSPGDWVIPNSPKFGGTWRSHAVVSADHVDKIPSTIQREYAATLGVSASTAYRLLNDFEDLKEGDVVVHNAGSGLVAQLVVQMAAARGIKTITILRPRHDFADTVERIKVYGGYIVVQDAYAKSNGFNKLIADLPAPKLALNGAGGESATVMARILAPGGTMVTYGNGARDHLKLPASLFLFNDIKLKGFNLQNWVETHTKEEREAMLGELVKLVSEEKLRFWVETHRLSDWEEALEKALKEQKNRKVLMILDQ